MRFLRFKRKRKITNAKIYEDKCDLYCMSHNLFLLMLYETSARLQEI